MEDIAATVGVALNQLDLKNVFTKIFGGDKEVPSTSFLNMELGKKDKDYKTNLFWSNKEASSMSPSLNMKLGDKGKDCKNILFHGTKEDPSMSPFLKMELGEQDKDYKDKTPATLPTQPATLPTQPATLPTQPATLPTQPATLPTQPAALPTHQKECNEGYRKQTMRYANRALDYFNQRNHTKYELLEDETTMNSNRFLNCDGVWTHCCFYAKDSSTKQFFAEIRRLRGLVSVVTACKILDGETHAGCLFCDSFIIHPVDGYQAGLASDYIFEDLPERTEDSLGPSLFRGYKEDPSMSDFLNRKRGEKDEDYKNKIPPPPTPAYLEECKEGYHKQCIKFANRALAYFNKENDTKYELVEDETMGSHPFLSSGGLWIHCCFNAKDSNDSSIRQFFGEINRRGGLIWVVTTCKILIGETHAGCMSCRSHIIHPVDGYLACFPGDYNSPAQQEKKLKMEEAVRIYSRNFPPVSFPR